MRCCYRYCCYWCSFTAVRVICAFCDICVEFTTQNHVKNQYWLQWQLWYPLRHQTKVREGGDEYMFLSFACPSFLSSTLHYLTPFFRSFNPPPHSHLFIIITEFPSSFPPIPPATAFSFFFPSLSHSIPVICAYGDSIFRRKTLMPAWKKQGAYQSLQKHLRCR